MIRAGDCREMGWSGTDVLITDPPYRPHVHKAIRSCAAQADNDRWATGNKHWRKGVRQNDLGFAAMTPELLRWTCVLAAEVRRWSVIFTDIESVGTWAEELGKAGASYIRAIPWVRWSMPQLSGDRPPQGSEMIVLAWGSARDRKSWNGPGNLTHFNNLCLRGVGKHPAEKPLDLILDLVQWFSDEGETVVDPFSGAGTVGLACRMLKRQFLGTELQEDWVTKANARIDAYPVLSGRDQDRFDTWSAKWLARKEDAERRAEVTAKAKARYGKKGAPAEVETPLVRPRPSTPSAPSTPATPLARDLVFRFWNLASSQRREIAKKFDLISDEEMKLAEPERYGRALLRAKERGLLEAIATEVARLEGT